MIETDPIELEARRVARDALRRGRPIGASRRRAALIERRAQKDAARNERRFLARLERDGVPPPCFCGSYGDMACVTPSGVALKRDHARRPR